MFELKTYDKDNDHHLDRAEVANFHLRGSNNYFLHSFDKMDLDKDGTVDLNELKLFHSEK